MKITMINSGLKGLRSILNKLNLPTTKGFRANIFMKLAYQYMAIFFTFSPTSSHLHSLQVENCGSNLQLVVDEDDNGKLKLAYQYMAILFTFSPTSSHLHSLQVENCGSNSQLVVDEDDKGKLKLERVKTLQKCALFIRHDVLSFHFNWMQAVTSYKSVMQF